MCLACENLSHQLNHMKEYWYFYFFMKIMSPIINTRFINSIIEEKILILRCTKELRSRVTSIHHLLYLFITEKWRSERMLHAVVQRSCPLYIPLLESKEEPLHTSSKEKRVFGILDHDRLLALIIHQIALSFSLIVERYSQHFTNTRIGLIGCVLFFFL